MFLQLTEQTAITALRKSLNIHSITLVEMTTDIFVTNRFNFLKRSSTAPPALINTKAFTFYHVIRNKQTYLNKRQLKIL
jgi:hypothetical protein